MQMNQHASAEEKVMGRPKHQYEMMKMLEDDSNSSWDDSLVRPQSMAVVVS